MESGTKERRESAFSLATDQMEDRIRNLKKKKIENLKLEHLKIRKNKKPI